MFEYRSWYNRERKLKQGHKYWFVSSDRSSYSNDVILSSAGNFLCDIMQIWQLFKLSLSLLTWLSNVQVNSIVIQIYKNRGKRIFEFGDRLDPPRWPPKFKNFHYWVKFQNCRKLYIWVSKLIRRKIQNQRKKN